MSQAQNLTMWPGRRFFLAGVGSALCAATAARIAPAGASPRATSEASPTARPTLTPLASPLPSPSPDRYAPAVLASRPAVFLRLGEFATSGSAAADASGNGHTGSYHGAPGYGEAGPRREQSDRAVRLDGMHDYIEVPDAPAFSVASSPSGLSVELWIRPDVLSFAGETPRPYVHLAGKGDKGDYEWGIRFYGMPADARTSRISAVLYRPDGTPTAFAAFDAELTIGNWYHIVASFDAAVGRANAGVRIYRDGVLCAAPAGSRDARYPAASPLVARGGAPVRLGTLDRSTYFAGGMADAALYPRVLSADEILAHFHASGRA